MQPPSFFAHDDNPDQWSIQNVASAISLCLGIMVTGMYVYSAFGLDSKTPVTFWKWLIGSAFMFSMSAWFKAGMGDTGFKEMLKILKSVVS